jgi:hypothetical protein
MVSYPMHAKRRRIEYGTNLIWVVMNTAILIAVTLWFILFLSIVKVYIEKSIYIP